jgi:hypothetical protein
MSFVYFDCNPEFFRNDFPACGKTHSWLQEASGHDFTSCGKNHNGGRRGFQPPHNANPINVGFSPGRMSFVFFACNPEFFRNDFTVCGKTHSWLQEASGHDFSRAVNAAKLWWALAPEARFLQFLSGNRHPVKHRETAFSPRSRIKFESSPADRI